MSSDESRPGHQKVLHSVRKTSNIHESPTRTQVVKESAVLRSPNRFLKASYSLLGGIGKSTLYQSEHLLTSTRKSVAPVFLPLPLFFFFNLAVLSFN